MKTHVTFSSHRVLTLLAVAVLGFATLGVSQARAQANLTFGGGLGAPLTLTLNAPVTYVITASPGGNLSPEFDFQGVGDVFGDLRVSGMLTFTISGGAAQTFSRLASGFTAGSMAATDAFIFGMLPGVAVGNTVVLQAGTLTTTTNFAGAPPASESYQTFIIDNGGAKLSAVNGVAGAVPEPGTWALLGVGAFGLGFALRRRVRACCV